MKRKSQLIYYKITGAFEKWNRLITYFYAGIALGLLLTRTRKNKN